uniref:Cation/H+ exchanger domain-containing protein n=1 Tax=Panagrolaimus superbus TaxID=310955 RepID=A0A914YIX3_9BILA
MAYLAYVVSELFHFSGIIGIIACGLFQTHYTMLNLTGKGYISINYIIKFLSSVSESLIFIILGVMLLNENSFFFDDWHPLFAIMALVFCVVARFVVVFFLTWIVNRFTGGVRYINFREQIIMSYGGLRGAVSFSLCFMIDNSVDAKPTLLAATYLVIMFTGSSMKTLVKMLNITLDHTNNFRLFCEFNKGMINHMTQGVEDLIGYSKNKTFMQKVRHLGSTYLRPYLIRNYTIRKTEDKLMSIENMENLKETLKSVPSQASFQRQQTINDMAENGQIDAIDECDALMIKNAKDREKEQNEKDINELINDVKQIRALCNDTLYPDRNLIDEELHERRQSLTTPKPSFLKHEVNKVINLNLTDIKNHRGIFGVRPKKKVSINKGIVSAACPSLGLTSHTNVSNHNVYRDVIDEVDETPDSPISPPGTARSRKSLGAIFNEFAIQQQQLQQEQQQIQPQSPPPQSLPQSPPQNKSRRNSSGKVLFHQDPIDKELSTEKDEDSTAAAAEK